MIYRKGKSNKCEHSHPAFHNRFKYVQPQTFTLLFSPAPRHWKQLCFLGSVISLKVKKTNYCAYSTKTCRWLIDITMLSRHRDPPPYPRNPPHPNNVFGKKMTCTTEPLKGINTRREENTYFNTFSRKLYHWVIIYIYIYIYIYAFSRRFYPKRLTVHSGYTFFYQYVIL